MAEDNNLFNMLNSSCSLEDISFNTCQQFNMGGKLPGLLLFE